MSSSGSAASSHSAEHEEEEMMFRCKRCKGNRQYFTAAEKDVHRQQHREEDQRARAQVRKPGPKTRTRGRAWAPSPAATDVTDFTLIEPIEVTPPPPSRIKINPPGRKQPERGAAASTSSAGKGKGQKRKRRIESKKKYDITVKSTKNPGA